MGLIVLMTTYHRPNDFLRSARSVLLHTPQLERLYILDNSTGGIDWALQQLDHPYITIRRSPENIGKGAIVSQHYYEVMHGNNLDHFVGMDSDVVVCTHWYETLLATARKVSPWAAIAPVYNHPGEPDHMHMMVPSSREVLPGVWYNPPTAGPLFLIRRAFWENWGGYPGTQIYGRDDGALCKEAVRRGLFIGYTRHVVMSHINQDSEPGYLEWKSRNIMGDVDGKGYWDT